MKEFIKKNLNRLIDLLFYPFTLVSKFIKNADNIFIKILKILLILILIFTIIFLFIAKPYNKLLSGFYIQKYKTATDLEKNLEKLYPLQTSNLQDYKFVFSKNNIYCFEEEQKKIKTNKCVGYENNIFKKYKLEIILTLAANDKTKITKISVKKTEIDNDFKTTYSLLKQKLNFSSKKE